MITLVAANSTLFGPAGLFAFASVLTALAGVIASWATLDRARTKAHAECEQNLKAVRRELEDRAFELHRLRMKELDADVDEIGFREKWTGLE